MEGVYTNEENQKFESDWWGTCLNTFGEEAKQISYAHRMGLENKPTYDEKWPTYNLGHKNIVDIGGGPVSMLLKSVERGPHCTVVDPCNYPNWVGVRYAYADIGYYVEPAETWIPTVDYDEAWIYNVLQHVVDPKKIIQNVRNYAHTIRIFEWVNTKPMLGHPHTLLEADLNEWLQGEGTVEHMTGENGCWGDAYYGVFRSW